MALKESPLNRMLILTVGIYWHFLVCALDVFLRVTCLLRATTVDAGKTYAITYVVTKVSAKFRMPRTIVFKFFTKFCIPEALSYQP